MNKWTAEEFERVIDEVMDRARADSAFRRLALADAAAAIARVDPKPLPAEFTVRFVEPGPKLVGQAAPGDVTRVIVLTPASDELSDADLENVAGGGDGSGTGVTWKP